MNKMKNPDKTGSYVALFENGYVSDVDYSKKHDLWNAYDSQTRERALKYSFNNIVAWIEKRKFIKFIKENGTVSR